MQLKESDRGGIWVGLHEPILLQRQIGQFLVRTKRKKGGPPIAILGGKVIWLPKEWQQDQK